MKVSKLSRNKPVRGKDLDSLIDAVNRSSNITGRRGVYIKNTPTGIALWGVMSAEEAKDTLTAKVRRAITTQAAPAATYITANLYDSSGIEITSGDESAINIHCSVIGGVNLNAAVPRLEDNDDIFVAKIPYASASEVVNRWYCINLFQKSQACD